MNEEIKDLSISEMLKMSHELCGKHKDTWISMESEYGKKFIICII